MWDVKHCCTIPEEGHSAEVVPYYENVSPLAENSYCQLLHDANVSELDEVVVVVERTD